MLLLLLNPAALEGVSELDNTLLGGKRVGAWRVEFRI